MNDVERQCRDPAMRWVVGDQAIAGTAENLVALAHLPGQWIDEVHPQRPPKVIVLDMDSSESPTYGDQEGSAYTVISAVPAITYCSCSTSSAMLSGAPCDP